MSTTKQRLSKWADRIASFDDERSYGEGCWIILRSGWQDATNPTCHTIHEDTPQAVLDKVAMAEPCACEDCRKDLGQL
jgi:hypothetical protein